MKAERHQLLCESDCRNRIRSKLFSSRGFQGFKKDGLIHSYCNIDKTSSVALVQHIESIPGINCPIYYIGGAFHYFPFHVEGEGISSTYYISSGSSKMWYAVRDSHKIRFQSFIATELLASNYVNDHHEGVKQVVATKNLLLNPALMANLPFQVDVIKIVQNSGQFVSFGHGDYDGGLLRI